MQKVENKMAHTSAKKIIKSHPNSKETRTRLYVNKIKRKGMTKIAVLSHKQGISKRWT